MKKALEGIKVLELCHAYNGPMGGMLMADNGADVIKIEPPGGDQIRTWGPFDEKSGESGFYSNVNRNKRGMTLNLKNEKALEIFYDLVKEADVVIENYRPGVADRLKVDYETLKEINPRIIYGSSSGFGQYGPYADRACYDVVAQSMGGLVNMTGFPDKPPSKAGPSVADAVTGVFLALGVSMALYTREKTGRGQQVDVAMVDTIFSILENAIPEWTLTEKIFERQGNIDPSIAPFDLFECSDGFVAVGVGNDRLFERFCKAIDRPDLLEDPKFETNDLRCRNYTDGLQEAISSWTIGKTRSEIEDLMYEYGIPCGPVLNMKEACEHPQILAREMLVEVDHPTIGKHKVQGATIKFSETPGGVEFGSPTLGQHTQEILGLNDEEFAQLNEEGVF